MKKGSLTHLLTLEPELFDSEYVLLPDEIKVRRGKAYDEFAAAVGNREILTAAEFEDGKRIATAVRSNPEALKIIENATGIEQSFFSEDFATGVKTKCRPDVLLGEHIYDLKTTRNAHIRSFISAIKSYRYNVQAAFYTDVCRSVGQDIQNFGFIVVDTETMPYQCTVFHRLSQEAIDAGRAEYQADLEVYARCLETNEWPGYPESYDEIGLTLTDFNSSNNNDYREAA